MTLNWSNPAYPVSYPASAVRCSGCGLKFQAGHVPVGDPVCAECAGGMTGGHIAALFPVADLAGGDT